MKMTRKETKGRDDMINVGTVQTWEGKDKTWQDRKGKDRKGNERTNCKIYIAEGYERKMKDPS